MTSSGRRGLFCAVVLTVSLLPYRAFAIDKLLIVNGTNLTMKPGQTEPFVGYVLVGTDGKIKAVGQGKPPAGTTAQTTYDAKGKFVLPGFISAHSHLSESAFRGLAADQYVYNYPAMTGWVEALEAREAGTKPEDYYWFTLQGALDHLVHGITSVYNFAYARDDDEAFEEYQWRAELASGMRFIHSYEPSGKSTPEVRRANLEKFLAAAQKDMGRPTVLRMAYSGWITTPEAMQLDASFLRDYHLYSEIHFLESPVNQEAQRKTFPYIAAANILGPNVSFGHFVHPDDAILKTAAAAGSGMVWNPMSNGRLASGIADIPKYRKLGIKVGMGVDGEGSSDLPDPFENMRMGLYVIRARYESARILQPIDVLRFHTMGSAEVLGVADKVGSLEVGKFGDIIVVDPKLVERGPVVDPYAAVVLACNAMNLAKVYVGGDLLVDTYRLQKNDMGKVSREVSQRVPRLH
jgi:cytosine/adenosine deaminase-related metal-dependent hydrolase